MVQKDAFHQGRCARVARGSGHTDNQVMELINKFAMMKTMMLQMGSASGLIGKIPGLKQLSQMKQMAGVDMEQLMAMSGMAPPEAPRHKIRPPKKKVSRAKVKAKRRAARKSRKKRKK